MNDQHITPSEPVETDLTGDALDDWIDGGSVARRSVPIYGKPGLYADFQQIQRDLEVARAVAHGGDELGGSDVTKLEARQQQLHEELMASKSIWYIKALADGDTEAVKDDMIEAGWVEPSLDEPDEPEAPILPDRPTDNQRKSHTIRVKEYEAAMETYRVAVADYDSKLPEHERAVQLYADEQNRRLIARALDRIEFADGRSVASVTPDQVKRLGGKFGNRQLLSLVAAIYSATYEDTPVIPAPFSQSNSEDDPT